MRFDHCLRRRQPARVVVLRIRPVQIVTRTVFPGLFVKLDFPAARRIFRRQRQRLNDLSRLQSRRRQQTHCQQNDSENIARRLRHID